MADDRKSAAEMMTSAIDRIHKIHLWLINSIDNQFKVFLGYVISQSSGSLSRDSRPTSRSSCMTTEMPRSELLSRSILPYRVHSSSPVQLPKSAQGRTRWFCNERIPFC